jgi:regulator of protease activity HflC (stomatin/prohibitin superfamily)
MAEAGIAVGTIALRDIVLPGEVREILNQVVTAEKQAQANLIRRREETAATRSLLYTARLMEDNPILVRLKELETLEKLSEKVERISVTGGFDGLLTELLATRSGEKR